MSTLATLATLATLVTPAALNRQGSNSSLDSGPSSLARVPPWYCSAAQMTKWAKVVKDANVKAD